MTSLRLFPNDNPALAHFNKHMKQELLTARDFPHTLRLCVRLTWCLAQLDLRLARWASVPFGISENE